MILRHARVFDSQMHDHKKVSIRITSFRQVGYMLFIFRYIYIEAPFWYEMRISQKVVINAFTVLGVVCHVIGFTPMMMSSALIDSCEKEENIVQLALSAAAFTIRVIILLAIGE